jgi:hypothetical protein
MSVTDITDCATQSLLKSKLVHGRIIMTTYYYIRRSSVPGPNQVGGERLTADNSSLSMLGAGVRGEEYRLVGPGIPFSTKPNNKMPHPFVTVLMH